MEPVGNQVLRNIDGKKVHEEEKEMEGIIVALSFVYLKNKTNKSSSLRDT